MANLDITIERGADWSRVWTIQTRDRSVVDISGATFVGQIKNPKATEDTITAEFDFDFVTDGTDGKVTMSLTDTQSLLLRPDRGYSYSAYMTLGGRRYLVLWGRAILNSNIPIPP